MYQVITGQNWPGIFWNSFLYCISPKDPQQQVLGVTNCKRVVKLRILLRLASGLYLCHTGPEPVSFEKNFSNVFLRKTPNSKCWGWHGRSRLQVFSIIKFSSLLRIPPPQSSNSAKTHSNPYQPGTPPPCQLTNLSTFQLLSPCQLSN